MDMRVVVKKRKENIYIHVQRNQLNYVEEEE